MASYNKVILMGHLTRDPQNGQLPSGTPVCDFGLAVNRRWKDAQGEAREEVLFIDCTAFGKVGQAIGTHLAKGRAIHVEGHLKLDTWAAEDGTKRSKMRVIVEQFRFVDGKGTDGNAPKPTAEPAGNGREPVHGTPKGRGGRSPSNGTNSPKPRRTPGNGHPTDMAGQTAVHANAEAPQTADIPF